MSVANTSLRHVAGARKKTLKSTKQRLSEEDTEIVCILERLKRDLKDMHNNLDYITDPILIDSCIYEIMSIHMRYQYYLKLCKEKGLVANLF